MYRALKSHGFVDAEEQKDVAAGVKRFFQELCVLLLSGPDPISLRVYDVVEIPRFDHKVSIICDKHNHESACVNGKWHERTGKWKAFRKDDWFF